MPKLKKRELTKISDEELKFKECKLIKIIQRLF